jgi:hypothetical protein
LAARHRISIAGSANQAMSSAGVGGRPAGAASAGAGSWARRLFCSWVSGPLCIAVQ